MANAIYGVYSSIGASGNFIMSMLAYMLTDDVVDMNFDDGSSHDYMRRYRQKLDIKISSLTTGAYHFYPQKYELLCDSILELPFPVVDIPVLPIPFTDFKSKDIIYKLIVIDLDENDYPLASYNHYYKQPEARPLIVNLSKKIFHVDDLTLLSNQQFNQLICHPDLLKVYVYKDNEINKFIDSLDETFKSQIYRFPFKDITQNPDKILTMLELVTNIPISDFARNQYLRYVERQKTILFGEVNK